MKKYILLLLISSLVWSCESSDETATTNIEGHYIGTFTRNDQSSNLELHLENQEFSGESETERFPAICRGSYSISGNTITFENECPWTADFDWTLILDGSWNYTWADGVMILKKANGDKYVLTEQ